MTGPDASVQVRDAVALDGFVLDRPVQDPARLGVITVTYNPDITILARQLSQLPTLSMKVVVDNASRPDLQAKLQDVVALYGGVLLRNEQNIGLPAAINQGCRFVREARADCGYLLLLDQDSEPGYQGAERLLAACVAVEAWSGKPCCVGPRLVDVSTGLEHGFHQMRGWRWVRLYPARDSKAILPLTNLNGSGTLMPWSVFSELGGLEEELFIDHVDTEWAFRVLARGWGLYGVTDVAFHHRMGDKSLRFWLFGWRVWPCRSPLRHFYLFRNARWLLGRTYVPLVWKGWAVVKLCLTLAVHGLFDPARKEQLKSMLRGLIAARRGPVRPDRGTSAK